MPEIKAHGEITVHKNNIAYIPKQVVNELGNKLKFVLNSKTILLYEPGTDPETILKSIDILKAHIALQIEGHHSKKSGEKQK